MIPALLSCLFVLYLYRVLNEPETSDHSLEDGPADGVDELQRRLDAISKRIQQLPESPSGADAK